MIVGIVYTILAGLLFVVSYLRHRHSRHDFSDPGCKQVERGSPTVGQTGAGKRVFGRPVVTAGWIVVSVSVVVACVEIGLLVLVLQL